MKTRLPNAINSEAEAKAYLTELYSNNEMYHPDDDAHDIVWCKAAGLVTEEDADKLNELMEQVFEHLPDPYMFQVNLIGD